MRRGQALLRRLLRQCLTHVRALRHVWHRLRQRRGVRRGELLFPGDDWVRLYLYPRGRHLWSTPGRSTGYSTLL
jgi:hypothetical protein